MNSFLSGTCPVFDTFSPKSSEPFAVRAAAAESSFPSFYDRQSTFLPKFETRTRRGLQGDSVVSETNDIHTRINRS